MEKKSLNKNGYSYPKNGFFKMILWVLFPFLLYFLCAALALFAYTIIRGGATGLSAAEILTEIAQFADLNMILLQQCMLIALLAPIFLVQRKYLPWDRPRPSALLCLWSVCLTLGVAMGLSALLSILFHFLSVEDKVYSGVDAIIGTAPALIQLLSVAVAAPLSEELMFRAIMLNRLRSKMPTWLAIVLSSLLFGLTHGNLTQFIHAGLLGIVLGYVYVRSGSLLVPILCHLANNLLSTLASLAGLAGTSMLISDIVIALLCLAGALLLCKKKNIAAERAPLRAQA